MRHSAHNKCFFLFSKKRFARLHDMLKPIQPVYNGAGWFIEYKFEKELQPLRQEAHIQIIEFPLVDETFEELRKRHKKSFFNEKAIRSRLQIENMKRQLDLSHIDNADILTPAYREGLQLSSQGARLVELLDEQTELLKHIRALEEEERLAALTLELSPFKHLLNPTDEIQISEELKKTSSGISVGYTINHLDLKLPGGALTILAAPTAHGKTTVSINFCLGALVHSDRSVYFFSYEESRAAIASLFLNTYIGLNVSMNNRESIANHLRDGTLPSVFPETHALFLKRKNEFFTSLIENGLLNVFYTDMSAKELVSAIRYLKKHTNVGLISIDYMQLLKMGQGRFGSRQEELKEICLLLKDCAVETGLPIMLGAQFNRTVVAEADLLATNIGEAGDIERIANTILGFWNRNFEGSRDGNRSKDGRPIPKEKAIYFEILKSRQLGSGHSEIMDFDGNTGKLRNRAKRPSNHALFG